MNVPPESILTIDCHYRGALKAAAYLIIEGDRATFVDNNTVHAVPLLLAALAEQGLQRENVDYAIITHVHLDHAGGSAELLKACPNATLLAHPKAARHITDPSRLIAGAKMVYGEELFHQLYGTIDKVPAERVRTMADGEVLEWGSRKLRFFNTLGHASHHFCVYDSASNTVFTGDSFGIGQSRLTRPGRSFLVCTSSPAEFDAVEARVAVQKIVDTGAGWAYAGHFGAFDDLPGMAQQLYRSIGQHEAILNEALASTLEGEALTDWCAARVREAMEDQLRWIGVENLEADLEWIGSDIYINGQGLAAVVERQRQS